MSIPKRSRSLGRAIVLVALVAGILSGCGGEAAAPDPGRGPDEDAAELVLTANVVGTPIATLAVRVTAPDLPQALVFNLVAVEGVASGVLRMPPGEARTITVQGFDALGQITHEGSATVDVNPGQNPMVRIALVPRAGQVPVEVTIAELSLIVTPSSASLEAIGATVQLTAQLTDAQGNVVAGQVSWGSSNPAVATVDANGLVQAVAAGTVEIVASFDVYAAVSFVTVTEGPVVFTGVSGTVTSTAGTPLEGVLVVVGNEGIDTDADGNYSIPTAPGPQLVQLYVRPAACNGTVSQQVVVVDGSATDADFTLTCTAGSNGVVANETDLAAEADFCNIQFPLVLSTPGSLFGRIFEAGVTEAGGASGSVMAELVLGAVGTDPRFDASWIAVPADYNTQVGNDDEYQFTFFGGPFQAAFTFRFSLNGGASWTYCDSDGAGSGLGLTFNPGAIGLVDLP